MQFSPLDKIVLSFLFMRLGVFHKRRVVECNVLLLLLALCSQYDLSKGEELVEGLKWQQPVMCRLRIERFPT